MVTSCLLISISVSPSLWSVSDPSLSVCRPWARPGLPDWPGPPGKWMKKSESWLSWRLLLAPYIRTNKSWLWMHGNRIEPCVDCGLISFIKIREIIAGTGGILCVRAWHRDTLTHSPGNWLPPVPGRNARRPLLCVRGRVLRDCNAGPVQGAGAGTVFSPVETSSWSRTRRRQSWHHVLATKNYFDKNSLETLQWPPQWPSPVQTAECCISDQ